MEVNEEKLNEVLKSLLGKIDEKHPYTHGHSNRVMKYASKFAIELGLPEAEKELFIYSACLHDVGKIEVDKNILDKRGPLDNQEWEIMKQHPERGSAMLSPINELNPIIPIIKHHHERYDGLGYPMGLKNKEIPYLSRALSIVDSYDAMTTKRPYKEALNVDEASFELKRCAGSQFDPEMVQVFLSVIEKGVLA